ncbi:MAG: glycine--tRNA ligase subunit beta, partial [Proteobacteria bacterium]|nr:glycine--tRNA ligase subunit beta [Pseudomonadota bacterium]
MTGELFIEIRCEELPASMVRPALKGLEDGVLALLGDIERGALRSYATPRRLAVVVAEVAAQRPLVEKLVTGPSADRAFVDGVPTKAAIGFARGKRIDVADLEIIDGPRGPVVGARITEGGEQTAQIVADGLDGVVRGLPFGKTMQWGNGGVRFARPLHSIAAIFAGQSLEGTAAGLAIGNSTQGHRLAQDTGFNFGSSTEWLASLRQRFVEPDLKLREEQIANLLIEAAKKLGSEPIINDDLLEEVLHLVECPTLVVGAFDEELLELPPRLLVETMKVHQRNFPVYRDGRLTNHFVVISNNPLADHETEPEGNARELRPRFYDARFFFAEDRKK